MKNLRKTLLATALIGAVTFGALGTAYADSLKDTAIFDQASITAQQAMDQAKSKFDGKVIEVELKHKKDNLYYEVKLLKDSETQEFKIDAKTGDVLGSKSEQKAEQAEKRQRLQQEVKISLTQAMDIAQQQTGGKIKEIEFKVKKDRPQYQVKMIVNGKIEKLRLDANTGERF
ncbi:PepSY domain-containing protein [Avibacterium paragallinarum]|uniref:Peptidase propeptide and YPEB domain n=1 Tax=Avibacterium paragallinarum TaxID=728 RepID=A0A0F5EY40_AVIPA|nr:PepSY domain-containing protein [Avibacterium paragallinarum]KAA6208880.1 hypothetical protein F1968_06825 [Avibacterium paragallinarum]KKB01295.1 hypothetical protein Z012_07375 [Avibacterium paragallinarum]POY47639.1 hypothetical protein C3364_00885 [Avibacterium paragallinarum]RZN56410.1 hypothetical protein EIG79_10370 [Avibacterium paragallinarum]RZN58898.1 hypothetical protein EIG78_02845 [Avibacterium paragallinarum]